MRRIVGFEQYEEYFDDGEGLAIIRPLDKKAVSGSQDYPPEVDIFSGEPINGLWIKQDLNGKMYALTKKNDVQYPVFDSPYFGYFGFAGEVASVRVDQVDPRNAGNNIAPVSGDIFILLGWAKTKTPDGVAATIDFVGYGAYSIDDKIEYGGKWYTVIESWHDGFKNVVRMSL